MVEGKDFLCAFAYKHLFSTYALFRHVTQNPCDLALTFEQCIAPTLNKDFFVLCLSIDVIAKTSRNNHWHSIEKYAVAIFSIMPRVDPIPPIQSIEVARMCLVHVERFFLLSFFALSDGVEFDLSPPAPFRFALLHTLPRTLQVSFVHPFVRVHEFMRRLGGSLRFPLVRGHGLLPSTVSRHLPRRTPDPQPRRSLQEHRVVHEDIDGRRKVSRSFGFDRRASWADFLRGPGTEISIHTTGRYRSNDEDLDETLSDPIAPVPADTSGSRGLPSSAPIALFPVLPRSRPRRLIPLGPWSCEDRCLLSKRMAIGLARVEGDDCNARLVRHFGFKEAPAAKGGKGWWDEKRGRKCSRKDACSAEPKRVGSVPRHVTERRVQIRTTHVRLRPSRSFQWVGSAKEVGEGKNKDTVWE